VTDVVHWYQPRGACQALMECRADEVLISGPAGTGKSRACMEKVHTMALLNPGMRALLLRKTLVSLTASGLVTWREKVAKEALDAGIMRWYGGSQQEPAQYQYRNGSRVVVGGLDDPTKIMSTEYDLIYVQEAIELTVTDWENASTRLRNGVVSFQQLIADTNPERPTHWLYERTKTNATKILHSRHTDNPMLYGLDGKLTEAGARYMARLNALTGVRRSRLLEGKWVSADGLVYDFDPAIHMVDRFPIPAQWPRVWSVDFGYTNPFVVQFWAGHPDGRWIRYREIYMSSRTVDQHAKTIMNYVSEPDRGWRGSTRYAHEGRVWTEPKPQTIICDHDAGDRATLSAEIGRGTTAAYKDVDKGIQAVQRRLRSTWGPPNDQHPGIEFMRDSLVERDTALAEAGKPTCTEEEFPGYVYPPQSARVAETKAPPEAPIKKDDHGMDATRYFVAGQDLAPRGRVRFM
jgi:PBSX family phage terminase large subunit